MRRGIESSILTMGEAMRKTAQSDMGAATNLLVKSAIDGMMQALRQSGRDALRDLSADTESYLAHKVAPNAGLVARTVTREAVQGNIDFTATFDDMDIDRDGIVTRAELDRYLASRYGAASQ